MTETARSVDSEGNVLAVTDTTPVATINFGRTVTYPDTFGAKEEASIFLQVPLTEGTTPEAITKQVEDAFATAKACVYTQLGLDATVQENGVVSAPAQVGTPKTTSGKGGGGRKPSGGSKVGSKPSGGFKQFTDEEKEEGWVALANANVEDKGSYLSITTQSGETVYDNRESKRSANGPDFKFKDSDLALWLKDAPEWFSGPGEGV